jgi:hypothetical protein|tara:strand:- start:2620 stop:2817 length:198 start_codon:yes stop_codon:yes gene_type:complete
MAEQYKLDREDGGKIVKVIAYAGISAAIAAAITVLGNLEVPGGYAVLIPIINTVLVAAQKFFKKA